MKTDVIGHFHRFLFFKTGCSDEIPDIKFGKVDFERRGPHGRFINGSEVTYSCNPGSHAYPRDTVTCDPRTNWNFEKLAQCIPGETLQK